MISTTALNLWKGIINGDYTYSQLETALTSGGRVSDFRQICVSQSAVKQLIEVKEIFDIIKLSSTARSEIFKISDSAKIWAKDRYAVTEIMKIGLAAEKALNTISSYWALRNDADNWAFLKSLVNNSGQSSKLKSDKFLYAGGTQTWTCPGGGIVSMNLIGIGGGHVDGGGGEVNIITRSTSLPNTNQTVSFPSPSPLVNVQFGSYLTAVGAGAGGTGGGTNTNGGYRSITDYDLENTPWLLNTCSAKGGDGPNGKAGGVNTGVWGKGGTGSTGQTTSYMIVNYIEA